MTSRKPPGVSWQTWIDRQIEQGREAGAFEDLPGYGKPIENLGGTRDELWWVREKLRRENVEVLPPALRIAKEREDALAEALAAPTEQRVREILDAVNTKIRYANSHVIEGPPSTSVVIDVDAVVEQWRSIERPSVEAPDADAVAEPAPARWWRRIRRVS